ncbi:MAG: 50S ribosomal protein L31e [Candidatus Aenigmatarchaeota archaeon]
MEEKIVTLNIRKDLIKAPKWKRSKVALRILKEKIKKICKTEKIKIDNSLNQKFWKNKEKCLSKIRVKITKLDENTSKVELMS